MDDHNMPSDPSCGPCNYVGDLNFCQGCVLNTYFSQSELSNFQIFYDHFGLENLKTKIVGIEARLGADGVHFWIEEYLRWVRDDEKRRLPTFDEDEVAWLQDVLLDAPASDALKGLTTDAASLSFNDVVSKPSSSTRWNQVLDMAPSLNLKELLDACAEAVSDADIPTTESLLNTLEQRVSVSGEPMERLSAYVLEGLRARLLLSGSIIYKKLKCKEPTSSELLSYMQVICPYYKFAYMSANVVIREAMTNENRINIIDFQIAQGSQWMLLLHDLGRRPGGPPFVCITGVDDSQSADAQGGGLQVVGERLAEVAKSCGVPFEFHGAALSGCEVQLENLRVRHGEALAVNFPYMLQHMPDESVSTINHRDRLLRQVKSLSPKIMTLVEQESNTNTAPFLPRFRETLDYYTAMFESIDAARPRDDKQRISAEQHCMARDIVNIIACEGADRVERHELFEKWRLRLMMAGFTPCPLSPSVGETINDMLKEYSPNYGFAESEGAIYLRWKNRALATSSAWR